MPKLSHLMLDWEGLRLERRAILKPFELLIEFSRRENRVNYVSCVVENSTFTADMARNYRCWVRIMDSLLMIFL